MPPFVARDVQYCQRNDILLTAYSPLDRGYLSEDPTVQQVAQAYDATPRQVALNWLIRQPKVIALSMSIQGEYQGARFRAFGGGCGEDGQYRIVR